MGRSKTQRPGEPWAEPSREARAGRAVLGTHRPGGAPPQLAFRAQRGEGPVLRELGSRGSNPSSRAAGLPAAPAVPVGLRPPPRRHLRPGCAMDPSEKKISSRGSARRRNGVRLSAAPLVRT